MKKSIVFLACLQSIFCIGCDATIRLYNLTSGLLIHEFTDEPTDEGPSFKMTGMRGQHHYINVNDSCSSTLPPPPSPSPPGMDNSQWFGLLQFNRKCYPLQILHIQMAGYAAALLSKDDEDEINDKTDKMMYALPKEKRDNFSLVIPSTFVSNSTKIILIAFSDKPNVTMVIYPDYNDINRFMLILLGTLCLAIVAALLLSAVMYGTYRVYRVRRSIVTKWKLKLLPTHTFQKGDSYEVCVICLDEYIEGAKLRVLSCGHAFHCKCVDPWLVKSGRECPLCKRKADLRRSKRSRRGDHDHDGGGAASSSDERAALLGSEARDNFDDDDDDEDANPVRIIPDGQTTINAIVHSSERQEPSASSIPTRRNYGATGTAQHDKDVPRVVVVGDSSAEHPVLGGDRVVAPVEQRATFYIGSVATDDGCQAGVEEAGEGVGPSRAEGPRGHSRVRSEGEESEEDFYDVRTGDYNV